MMSPAPVTAAALCLVLLAACGMPSASADPGATAAKAVVGPIDPYAGVTWTVPSALESTDAWTVVCPASCKQFEGREGVTDDEWPLVVLHQPASGTPDAYIQRWRDAHKTQSEYDPEIVNRVAEAAGAGQITAIIAHTEDDSGSMRETAMLMIYDTGGVLVPVEIIAFDAEDIAQRLGEAGDLLESVKVDVAKAAANIAGVEKRLKDLAAGIDSAYRSGKEAMLFMATQSGLRTGYGLSGMELQAYRDSTIYALVPGGALFTEIPDNLRKPDLAQAQASGTLGSWSASGAGYAITLPDGTQKALRKNGGGVNDGEIDLPLIDRLSPAHVPGKFESIAVSSAGGMGVGSDTFIASRADFLLVLNPNGQFEQSVGSYTSASGSAFVIGTGNDDLVRGQWSYDPAAYTLTLKPDNGAPVISAPFFCYGCNKTDVKTANWDWFVLGDDDWWMANKDD